VAPPERTFVPWPDWTEVDEASHQGAWQDTWTAASQPGAPIVAPTEIGEAADGDGGGTADEPERHEPAAAAATFQHIRPLPIRIAGPEALGPTTSKAATAKAATAAKTAHKAPPARLLEERARQAAAATATSNEATPWVRERARRAETDDVGRSEEEEKDRGGDGKDCVNPVIPTVAPDTPAVGPIATIPRGIAGPPCRPPTVALAPAIGWQRLTPTHVPGTLLTPIEEGSPVEETRDEEVAVPSMAPPPAHEQNAETREAFAGTQPKSYYAATFRRKGDIANQKVQEAAPADASEPPEAEEATATPLAGDLPSSPACAAAEAATPPEEPPPPIAKARPKAASSASSPAPPEEAAKTPSVPQATVAPKGIFANELRPAPSTAASSV